MSEDCTLQDWFELAGIRYFSVAVDHKILSPTPEDRRRGVVVPPRELWDNAIPTLEALDMIRHRVGLPIAVVSGYRTDEYNEFVGGEPDSEHEVFKAFDIRCRDMDLLIRVATEVLDELAALGIPTGLGLYDTFIHVDVGATRDWPRRWNRRTK